MYIYVYMSIYVYIYIYIITYVYTHTSRNIHGAWPAKFRGTARDLVPQHQTHFCPGRAPQSQLVHAGGLLACCPDGGRSAQIHDKRPFRRRFSSRCCR